jgi:hypothetical protein
MTRTAALLVLALATLASPSSRAQAPAGDPVDPAAGPAPVEPTPPAPAAHTPDAAAPPSTDPKDQALLAAFLALEGALAIQDDDDRVAATSEAIRRIAVLDDERAVQPLLRLSRAPDRPVRLSAVAALGGFVRVPEALRRLKEALGADAPPAEAAVALPALLDASRDVPEAAVPCPERHACAPDGVLLDALLAYATTDDHTAAVKRVVDAGDARAPVPLASVDHARRRRAPGAR